MSDSGAPKAFSNAREVQLTQEPVELFKVLKFEALVGSGGEAKLVIADRQVRVNGEVETRKRRKLVAGDRIDFDSESLLLVAAASDPEAPSDSQ